MPPQRSKKTCSQCRARKVKCNGSPELSASGACDNCDRLSFECSLVRHHGASDADVHPERKRGPRACTECRAQKSKCTAELPACSSCQKRGKECVYPELARNRSFNRRRPSHGHQGASYYQSPAMLGSLEQADQIQPTPILNPFAAKSRPEDAVSSPDQSWRSPSSFNSDGQTPSYPLPLPPVREQLQLVIDFFRHIYPLPVYSFLNEVSVTQRCLDRSLDKTLLLSLCSISALQLGYAKYHPVFTSSWIKQAEGIIWDFVDHPNIFRTQALILIVRYQIDTGNFQKAFMLSSLAARAASALRLQYERSDLSSLAQEIRRRLMWCLVILDSHFSTGLPECEMCPFEAVYLQPPCKEEDFNSDQDAVSDTNTTLPLDGVPEDGLLAVILRQVVVRRDAMRLKRQASLYTQPMPQLEAIVSEFSRTLDGMQIPPYSTAELQRYTKSRWLMRYLVVQLSWRQCYMDVYRHFLPGHPEAAPSVVTSECSPSYITEAAGLCLRHAQANIRILIDVAETAMDLVVVDVDIAVCGYHAARMVLFLSHSSVKPPDTDLTPGMASSMAQSVLDILKRLFPRSSLVTKIISHLEAIMRSHAADEPEPTRDSSDVDEDNGTRALRFAYAAKSHQRLGIHSILRQARFVDNSHEAAAGTYTSSADTHSGLLQSAISSYGRQLDTTPLSLHSVPPMYSGLVEAGSSQSPLDSTAAMSQFPPNADPFNLGSADNWSEVYLPTVFSAVSDGDFF